MKKTVVWIWIAAGVSALFLLFVIAMPWVRMFVVQPHLVAGDAMLPALEDGQYIFVKPRVETSKIMRGDIVLFRYPRDPALFFVKRVIGLPGDAIEITDGSVLINGQEESAFDELSGVAMETNGSKQLVLGEKEFFLMGDNRSESLDSRSFGPVNASYIFGVKY